MVLAMRTWGIREWLMAMFALVWAVVTLMLTVRSSPVVEDVKWWGLLGAGELALWRIFAPAAPPGGE